MACIYFKTGTNTEIKIYDEDSTKEVERFHVFGDTGVSQPMNYEGYKNNFKNYPIITESTAKSIRAVEKKIETIYDEEEKKIREIKKQVGNNIIEFNNTEYISKRIIANELTKEGEKIITILNGYNGDQIRELIQVLVHDKYLKQLDHLLSPDVDSYGNFIATQFDNNPDGVRTSVVTATKGQLNSPIAINENTLQEIINSPNVGQYFFVAKTIKQLKKENQNDELIKTSLNYTLNEAYTIATANENQLYLFLCDNEGKLVTTYKDNEGEEKSGYVFFSVAGNTSNVKNLIVADNIYQFGEGSKGVPAVYSKDGKNTKQLIQEVNIANIGVQVLRREKLFEGTTYIKFPSVSSDNSGVKQDVKIPIYFEDISEDNYETMLSRIQVLVTNARTNKESLQEQKELIKSIKATWIAYVQQGFYDVQNPKKYFNNLSFKDMNDPSGLIYEITLGEMVNGQRKSIKINFNNNDVVFSLVSFDGTNKEIANSEEKLTNKELAQKIFDFTQSKKFGEGDTSTNKKKFSLNFIFNIDKKVLEFDNKNIPNIFVANEKEELTIQEFIRSFGRVVNKIKDNKVWMGQRSFNVKDVTNTITKQTSDKNSVNDNINPAPNFVETVDSIINKNDENAKENVASDSIPFRDAANDAITTQLVDDGSNHYDKSTAFNQTGNALTQERLNLIKSRFSSLSNRDLKFVADSLLSNSWAQWTKAGIALRNAATENTLRHEIWHEFTQSYLTQAERETLYKEVAEIIGSRDITESEEYLAEQFETYKNTQRQGNSVIRQLFARLWNFLKSVFGVADTNITIASAFEQLEKAYQGIETLDRQSVSDYQFTVLDKEITNADGSVIFDAQRVAEITTYLDSFFLTNNAVSSSFENRFKLLKFFASDYYTENNHANLKNVISNKLNQLDFIQPFTVSKDVTNTLGETVTRVSIDPVILDKITEAYIANNLAGFKNAKYTNTQAEVKEIIADESQDQLAQSMDLADGATDERLRSFVDDSKTIFQSVDINVKLLIQSLSQPIRGVKVSDAQFKEYVQLKQAAKENVAKFRAETDISKKQALKQYGQELDSAIAKIEKEFYEVMPEYNNQVRHVNFSDTYQKIMGLLAGSPTYDDCIKKLQEGAEFNLEYRELLLALPTQNDRQTSLVASNYSSIFFSAVRSKLPYYEYILYLNNGNPVVTLDEAQKNNQNKIADILKDRYNRLGEFNYTVSSTKRLDQAPTVESFKVNTAAPRFIYIGKNLGINDLQDIEIDTRQVVDGISTQIFPNIDYANNRLANLNKAGTIELKVKNANTKFINVIQLLNLNGLQLSPQTIDYYLQGNNKEEFYKTIEKIFFKGSPVRQFDTIPFKVTNSTPIKTAFSSILQKESTYNDQIQTSSIKNAEGKIINTLVPKSFISNLCDVINAYDSIQEIVRNHPEYEFLNAFLSETPMLLKNNIYLQHVFNQDGTKKTVEGVKEKLEYINIGSFIVKKGDLNILTEDTKNLNFAEKMLQNFVVGGGRFSRIADKTLETAIRVNTNYGLANIKDYLGHLINETNTLKTEFNNGTYKDNGKSLSTVKFHHFGFVNDLKLTRDMIPRYFAVNNITGGTVSFASYVTDKNNSIKDIIDDLGYNEGSYGEINITKNKLNDAIFKIIKASIYENLEFIYSQLEELGLAEKKTVVNGNESFPQWTINSKLETIILKNPQYNQVDIDVAFLSYINNKNLHGLAQMELFYGYGGNYAKFAVRNSLTYSGGTLFNTDRNTLIQYNSGIRYTQAVFETLYNTNNSFREQYKQIINESLNISNVRDREIATIKSIKKLIDVFVEFDKTITKPFEINVDKPTYTEQIIPASAYTIASPNVKAINDSIAHLRETDFKTYKDKNGNVIKDKNGNPLQKPVVEINDEQLETYNKINTADAASIVSVDFDKLLAIQTGQEWTEDKEFHYLKEIFRLTDDNDIDQYFRPVIKPHYGGVVPNADNTHDYKFTKTAFQLATGTFKHLGRAMSMQNIASLVTKDGHKLNTNNEKDAFIKFHDDDGNVINGNTNEGKIAIRTSESYCQFLKIIVSNEAHYGKQEIVMPKQMIQLIPAHTTFLHEGKEIYFNEDLEQAVNDYNDAFTDLSEGIHKEIQEIIKYNPITNRLDNLEGLRNLIEKELARGDASEILRESLSIVKSQIAKNDTKVIDEGTYKFEYDPDMVLTRQKLTLIITSLVNRKAIRMNTTGDMVAMSSSFFESYQAKSLTPSSATQRTVFKNKISVDPTLGFYRLGTINGKVQTLRAGCKIAMNANYLSLLKLTKNGTLDELNSMISELVNKLRHDKGVAYNIELSKEELLLMEKISLNGTRIPTQGLNSMEALIIESFFPMSNGGHIMVYKEMCNKAGSDFDFDKLVLRYTELDKNGNIKTTKDKDGNIKQLATNRLNKATGDLLLNRDRYMELIKPNGVESIQVSDSLTDGTVGINSVVYAIDNRDNGIGFGAETPKNWKDFNDNRAKELNSTGFDVVTPKMDIQSTDRGQKQKAYVGVSAKNNTTLAILKAANIRFNTIIRLVNNQFVKMPTNYFSADFLNKYVIADGTLTLSENTDSVRPMHVVDGKFEQGSESNAVAKKTAMDQVINTFVDGLKIVNPLTQANVKGKVVSVFEAMINMGLHPFTGLLLVNQPLVLRHVRNSAINSSPTVLELLSTKEFGNTSSARKNSGIYLLRAVMESMYTGVTSDVFKTFLATGYLPSDPKSDVLKKKSVIAPIEIADKITINKKDLEFAKTEKDTPITDEQEDSNEGNFQQDNEDLIAGKDLTKQIPTKKKSAVLENHSYIDSNELMSNMYDSMFTDNQLQHLRAYIIFEQYSNHLYTLATAFDYPTNPQSSFYGALEKKEAKNDTAITQTFKGTEKIFTNTVIKNFDVNDLIINTLSSVFELTTTKQFTDLQKSTEQYIRSALTDRFNNTFVNDFFSFVTQNFATVNDKMLIDNLSLLFNSTTLQDTTLNPTIRQMGVITDGVGSDNSVMKTQLPDNALQSGGIKENTFMSDLINAKEKYGNKFLEQCIFDVKPDKIVRNLKVIKSNEQIDGVDDLAASFNDLMRIDPDLANRIVAVSLLQDGQNKTMYSFSQYISPKHYKNIVEVAKKRYLEESVLHEDQLLKAYQVLFLKNNLTLVNPRNKEKIRDLNLQNAVIAPHLKVYNMASLWNNKRNSTGTFDTRFDIEDVLELKKNTVNAILELPKELENKVIETVKNVSTIKAANEAFQLPIQSSNLTANDRAILAPAIDEKQKALNKKYFGNRINATLQPENLEKVKGLTDYYLVPKTKKSGFLIVVSPYTDQFNILLQGFYNAYKYFEQTNTEQTVKDFIPNINNAIDANTTVRFTLSQSGFIEGENNVIQIGLMEQGNDVMTIPDIIQKILEAKNADNNTQNNLTEENAITC